MTESKLVYLKRGNGQDTIILLPGLGGSVLGLVPLTRAYLGSEMVIGIEPSGPGPGSIAELAASHATAVLPERPRGHWHLAGHGLGATVGMEMAACLAAAGERVGVVVLLEPLLRLGDVLDAEERRCAEARRHAADRVRRAVLAGGVGPDLREDLDELGLDAGLVASGPDFACDLLARVDRALSAYLAHSPRPVPAPVHVLVAEAAGAGVDPLTSRLRELSGDVTVHRLSCPPDGLLRRPHATVAARALASLTAAASG